MNFLSGPFLIALSLPTVYAMRAESRIKREINSAVVINVHDGIVILP